MNKKPWGKAYPFDTNETALCKAYQLMLTIRSLKKLGLDVIGFQFNGSGQPTIELLNCKRLREYVKEGKANYYQYNTKDKESNHQGCFFLNNCRVVWTEGGT